MHALSEIVVLWVCSQCGLRVESIGCPPGWMYDYREVGTDGGIVTEETDLCGNCLEPQSAPPEGG